MQIDQLFREHPHPVNTVAGPTNVHPQVAAIGPTQLRKPLREPGEPTLSHRIVFIARHQHADPPHAVALLRPRRERPRRRAADRRDEIPSSHGVASYSITSVARSSVAVGTSMPSAFAVLRLSTISMRVDCCTGRSAGFSPLRMRPT